MYEKRRKTIYKLVGVVLVSGAVSLAGGCFKNRFERGYQFKEPPNVYDPAKEYLVRGKVTEVVGMLYEEEVPVSMVRMTDGENKRYIVQIAPSWYLKMERFKLKVGEEVEVTGCPVGIREMAPQSQTPAEPLENELTTFLARKIKSVTNPRLAIKLRNEEGVPLWYGKGRAIGKQRYIQQMIDQKKAIPEAQERF